MTVSPAEIIASRLRASASACFRSAAISAFRSRSSTVSTFASYFFRRASTSASLRSLAASLTRRRNSVSGSPGCEMSFTAGQEESFSSREWTRKLVSACFSVENFFNARIVSPVTAYLASAGAAEVRSFTDPAYGMGKESDGVQNDNQNQNDLLEFNKKWIALSFSILKENGSWYCWGIDEPLMDIYAFILRPMIAANQITFRNYITWAKHSAFGVNSELMRSYPRETEKCLFVMCGVEGFNNNKDHFNDAYEAILDYMVGEAQKVGLKAKQLTEITGVQMWGHWFSKSQFTPIPEWHYKKLQQAFKGRAFSLPHDQVMKLRNKPSEAYQSMKAEAMELRAFFDNTHNDSDEHDIMTDVWGFPITNTAERDDAGGHATPKPIALCERAILSSSRPGELVVDFFGGSGSTLIACEHTGRTCAMIELEPKWCDVIVRRYIKTTGDNNVRCVRQGRELPREEIAAIFEPDEEGGEQE